MELDLRGRTMAEQTAALAVQYVVIGSVMSTSSLRALVANYIVVPLAMQPLRMLLISLMHVQLLSLSVNFHMVPLSFHS